MASTKANVLENHLRQKVIQFEQSLARISETRKHLRDNADLVKSEIRATFGSQLTQMRRREQQLLETLDTVASVKDGILSEQQDHLHQALGACIQGLEWYQTAVEDMKENRLSSMDTVEHHINDVLKKLSVVDIKPRETAVLSFEADALALRKAIASFGHVRTGKSTNTKQSFESLPAQLEDYEDEDVVHSLLHKALNRQGKNSTIFVGRPTLSNDPKDWLLREALTGHHSAPLTPEHSHDLDHSTTYVKHCTSDGGKSKELRQAQVHSWLHHIKNQVETEPNVFEDFEIVKDREVKNSVPVDSIKAELSDDVAEVFRPYFEAVLLSPANQWLSKSMEKMDFSYLSSMAGNMSTNAKNDPLVRDFVMEGDVEDIDSLQTAMTYESSGDYDPGHAENIGLIRDTYAKLWNQFVNALWSSTDSLWILPCSSDDKPTALSGEITTESTAAMANKIADQFGLSIGSQRQQVVLDTAERLLTSLVSSMSLDHQHKADYNQWLLGPSVNRPLDPNAGGSWGILPSNNISSADQKTYEEWLGWKALVDRIKSMGDQHWLYQPPAGYEPHTNYQSPIEHQPPLPGQSTPSYQSQTIPTTGDHPGSYRYFGGGHDTWG